jgi:hypothetical protein
MPFVTSLELRYVGVGRYELLEPLVYRGAVDTIVVPAGFLTDLASVPRIAQWLLPPDGMRALRSRRTLLPPRPSAAWALPAVLHDWGCHQLRSASSPISSRDVDGLFRRCCREMDTPLLARWLLWTGVRWGALFNPARRDGWIRDAPAVLALSLLAAPLVVPTSLVVLVALAVYAVAEALVSLFDPTAGGTR